MRAHLATPLAAVAVVTALCAPSARADWTAPAPVTPVMDNAALFGLAAAGDAPAVLVTRRIGMRRNVLELRSASRARGPLGAPIRIATSEHTFGGANGTSALGGGHDGDRSAAWLQILGGVRRPVVATGSRLADREVLTGAGSRSTQVLAFAANRLGDAVVAFWRYGAGGPTTYEVLAAYRHAGRPFGTPQVVATGTPSFPVVTIGESGAAAAGWSTPQGVAVAEHLAGGGDAFGPAALVPGSAGAGDALALAEGDDGRAVAAWAARGTPGAVRVSDRAAGERTWSDPVAVTTSAATVRASSAPGLAVNRDLTLVAWTQANGAKPEHDVSRLAVRRGSAWDAKPATVDPGIRGRTLQTRLLAPTLGRPASLIASAFRSRRVVTDTVRGDGTLGPPRTITMPATAPLAFGPLAAQGANSTWLAFPRLRWPGQDVALSRSR